MDDIRWNGLTHQEIYDQVWSGPGHLASVDAQGMWASIQQELADVDLSLQAETKNLGEGWAGTTAAEAAQNLQLLGSWVTQAVRSAAATGAALDTQAEHVATMRNSMPAPPAPVSVWDPDSFTGGNPFGPISVVGDWQAEDVRRSELAAQAVQVMETYTANSARNKPHIHPFATPVTVTAGSTDAGGVFARVIGGVAEAARNAAAVVAADAARRAGGSGPGAGGGVVAASVGGAVAGGVGAGAAGGFPVPVTPGAGGGPVGRGPGGTVGPGPGTPGGAPGSGRTAPGTGVPGLPGTRPVPGDPIVAGPRGLPGGGAGSNPGGFPGGGTSGLPGGGRIPGVPGGAFPGAVPGGSPGGAGPAGIPAGSGSGGPATGTGTGPGAGTGGPTASQSAASGRSATPGYVPGAGMGAGAGAQAREHRRPSYLVDDTDAFGDDRWFTAAVITPFDVLPRR